MQDDDDDGENESGSALKITPYAMPTMPVAGSVVSAAADVSAPGAPLTGAGGLSGGIVLGKSATSVPSDSITSSSGVNLTKVSNSVVGLKASTTSSGVWGKKPAVVAPPPEPAAGNADILSGMTIAGGSQTADVFSQQEVVSPTVVPAPVAAPAAPATVVEPEKSKELCEKEKLAAQLFGGLNSSSASGIGSRRRSTNPRTKATIGRTTTPPPLPQVSSAAAASHSEDFLDLMGDDNATSTAEPPNGADMFSGMDIGAGTAQTLQPAAVAHDLFDCMDFGSTAAASPPVPPTVENGLDILGDIPVEASTTPFLMNDISGIMSQFDVGASAPVCTLQSRTSIVQPHPMNTQEFGGKWGRMTVELKNSFACSEHIRTLTSLQSIMTKVIGDGNGEDTLGVCSGGNSYYHVESIQQTNEAIFSGLSGAETILVHIKIVPSRNRCDVMIKCCDRAVASKVMEELGNAQCGRLVVQ